MGTRMRLFWHKEPFDLEGTEQLFTAAIRQNATYHMRHCAAYRSIAEAEHFRPDLVQTLPDIAKLPLLPTALFKRHALFSMPKWRIPVKATSHGTSGNFSRIGLDTGSLLAGLGMVLRMARTRGLLSLRPVNYIILGYKPHRGHHMAVMKTAYGSTFLAPALHRVYALKPQGDTYQPDLEGVLDALQRFSGQRHPVRFMGFPSYLWFLLQMMEERGMRCPLPPGSKIMLGGGWKQHYREQVEKPVLYALVKRLLDVDETEIIEFFGAAEHPILFTDCPYHHFHVPIYSRVLIRDVHSLEVLPTGQTGLVNLITPMLNAVPVTSIMTDDLGVLHEGKECPCGCKAPYLEIIGRVGMPGIKTCAAGASDILKGVDA